MEDFFSRQIISVSEEIPPKTFRVVASGLLLSCQLSGQSRDATLLNVYIYSSEMIDSVCSCLNGFCRSLIYLITSI